MTISKPSNAVNCAASGHCSALAKSCTARETAPSIASPSEAGRKAARACNQLTAKLGNNRLDSSCYLK